MRWYATDWENNTTKHLKDNLPVFPDDPAFAEKFIPQSSSYASPSTSKQALPHEKEVIKWAQSTKCFSEENKLLMFP